ncbi:DNA-directed RNA polymerase subunit omega [Flavobacteriales bacterium]|nr:DNA-directed RNA polymerase subunit omega [Flavobacteriales bacterium]MDG1146573.1 DNA-directed RNA polymerase subunit omega [Flavobacteriales bacterium]MDG1396216.1 DNA-directed RNA polymerase subunit omega [Flavobacteriales bacterium]|tara:strand:- start:24 stop:347 length:324 start_codon:yes stop_codon:yes gene_type:complete
MDYKKTNATKTTITNNTKLFEDKVGNIYSAIVALDKRSNQISSEIKEELLGKLDEFATHNDNLDEVFENKEQIEVSKFYEKLPKPTLIAIRELLDDELFVKTPKKED